MNPPSPKILIADDDPVALQAASVWLKKSGLTTATAENAIDFLSQLASFEPDLVLLDVQFGDSDGIALCRQLRLRPATRELPIILVSGAHLEEKDQVSGLEHGADDYLLKPLNPKLLGAKVNAILRRRTPFQETEKILTGFGLRLDIEARRVSASGREISLTRKEFDLLTTLFKRRGKVVSPRFLLESVWGYELSEYNDTHTIEVHVSRLKKKLGKRFSNKLATVVGAGYRLS